MIRYAITNGTSSVQDLVANAKRWAAEGIDFVQLREKDLPAGALVQAATAMLAALREHGQHTKLLLNARADVAVAAGADGVHLTARSGELTPQQVRQIYAASSSCLPIVSVSCHSVLEVQRARDEDADLILFGPVFEKRVDDEVVVNGLGLELLREACDAAGAIPTLALGGISLENFEHCVAAGAAGMAGIRAFA
jgi:thiamine-phosphate pyrophosphorylase